MQEPQRRIVVDDAKAERLREEMQRAVEVAGIEIDVDDLARTVGDVAGVGMVGAIGDKGEVAAVRILAGKAVTAARRTELCRRARLGSRRRDLFVKASMPARSATSNAIRTTAGCDPPCSPSKW